jgi:hypothetical protein
MGDNRRGGEGRCGSSSGWRGDRAPHREGDCGVSRGAGRIMRTITAALEEAEPGTPCDYPSLAQYVYGGPAPRFGSRAWDSWRETAKRPTRAQLSAVARAVQALKRGGKIATRRDPSDHRRVLVGDFAPGQTYDEWERQYRLHAESARASLSGLQRRVRVLQSHLELHAPDSYERFVAWSHGHARDWLTDFWTPPAQATLGEATRRAAQGERLERLLARLASAPRRASQRGDPEGGA